MPIIIYADFACTAHAVGDPDDCMAVEALRNTLTVDILAVVAAAGNADEETSYYLGKSLFPDLHILRGSRLGDRAEDDSTTNRKIAEVISNNGNMITVLVLSPATDFAKLVGYRRSIIRRFSSVIFVAGRSPGDQFRVSQGGRTLRDMNYEKDRRSLGSLLPILHEERIKTTFVGFRAGMNTSIPSNFVPAAFAFKSRVSWERKAKFWFGAKLPPFDVVAAMVLTKWKNNLRCRPVSVRAGRQLVLHNSRTSTFNFCE